MNSLLTTLPSLMPTAYAWAENQEMTVQELGLALDEQRLADARMAEVICPEKIRLLRAGVLPKPENADVMFIATHMGLFDSRSAGLTVGYSICFREDRWEDRHALMHEFVHVAQYERLGGVRPFLDVYLRECIDPGYPFGRLEQEAIKVAKDICKPTESETVGRVDA